MNWDALSALADTLAAVAVITSLVYVAVQVRQNTQHSRFVAQHNVVNELGRALEAIAQSADLAEIYVRALKDYDQLTVVERARFSSLFAHLFKLFDELHLLYLDHSLDEDQWRGFERALEDIVAYPGVQVWWETRSRWQSERFRSLVESKIASAVPRPIYREAEEAERRPGE